MRKILNIESHRILLPSRVRSCAAKILDGGRRQDTKIYTPLDAPEIGETRFTRRSLRRNRNWRRFWQYQLARSWRHGLLVTFLQTQMTFSLQDKERSLIERERGGEGQMRFFVGEKGREKLERISKQTDCSGRRKVRNGVFFWGWKQEREKGRWNIIGSEEVEGRWVFFWGEKGRDNGNFG